MRIPVLPRHGRAGGTPERVRAIVIYFNIFRLMISVDPFWVQKQSKLIRMHIISRLSVQTDCITMNCMNDRYKIKVARGRFS